MNLFFFNQNVNVQRKNTKKKRGSITKITLKAELDCKECIKHVV